MNRYSMHAGLGLAALLLACGGSPAEEQSDPASAELGESTEAIRGHRPGSSVQPAGPVQNPTNPGNGSTSSPPSPGNGSVGSPVYPPHATDPAPGCADPAPPVSCPASCPIPGLCRVCPDGSCGTPNVACNADGSCGAVTFSCEPAYDPCGGKRNGDTCTICDPKDANCVEDTSLEECRSGVCVASATTCPEQCPVIAICQVCADGSCADAVVSCNPDGSCGNVTFACN